jgi:putative protease
MESIRKNKPRDIELEVFVHGALCYCISGLCLASSFLGGMSGNRGRCTQVCRRSFSAPDNRAGFYFSPKDLSLVEQIQKLRHIGINSLKIEGRMKGASYVHTVVSAFRAVLDSPENISSSVEKLSMDFGREKTSLFFEGLDNNEVIVGNRPSGTGELLGAVTDVLGSIITIKGQFAHLQQNDRIRFHGQDGFEGQSGKIAAVSFKDQSTRIELKQSLEIKIGDTVFLTGSSAIEKQLPNIKEISVKPAAYRESCPFSSRILKSISSGNHGSSAPGAVRLYIRINSTEWLTHIQENSADAIILCPESADIQQLSAKQHLFGKWKNRLIINFPPFIPEKDVPGWINCVEWLKRAGVSRWMISNIGQRAFPFSANDEIIAGREIWCMNRASGQALAAQGIRMFSFSPEDDIMNLKTIASTNGLMTIFAYIPLFVSRIQPPSPQNAELGDSKNNKFFTTCGNRLFYLVGSQPFSLLHRREALCEAGIQNFLIDLFFRKPDRKLLEEILESYREQRKIEGSSMFNHKAGLK